MLSDTERCLERWKSSKALFIAQVLGLEAFPFQVVMLEFKGVKYANKTYQLTLLPRGSGKSEFGTIGDAIWEICHNPNITMQFIAETRDLSIDFLDAVKTHFESNEVLRQFYGDHVSPQRWSATRIISRQRTIVKKEPTIQCLGAGGAVVGRHVDIQYLDDVVSEKNSATLQGRDKLEKWYNKLICPILKPGGVQKIRGTRYYANDLYEYIMRIYGDESYFIESAIQLDAEYEEISYCPDMFPIEALQAERKKDPVSFALQYQNDTRVLQSNIIDVTKLIIVEPNDIPHYRELIGYQGIDPALKKEKKADLFSITTIGVHYLTGLIYILRQVEFREDDPDAMLRNMVAEYHWFTKQELSITCAGVEANAFQNLLVKGIQAHPEKYGILPFKAIYNLKDGSQRLHAISSYFNLEQVRISNECYRLIVDLPAFPNVRFRDRVDSMMNAFQVMESSGVSAVGLPINLAELTRDTIGIISLG